MPSYRNISLALVGSTRDLLFTGSDVVVKERVTKELVSRNTRLERPLERYLSVPNRQNDIVAQFAESMWVLWVETTLSGLPNTFLGHLCSRTTA